MLRVTPATKPVSRTTWETQKRPLGCRRETRALESPEGGAMADEPDLDRLADRVMDEPVIAEGPPDTRANVGYETALAYGKKVGLTDEAAKDSPLWSSVGSRTNLASRNESTGLSQT